MSERIGNRMAIGALKSKRVQLCLLAQDSSGTISHEWFVSSIAIGRESCSVDETLSRGVA